MASVQGSKTICLITPGHIASNPRIVKEAAALSQAGFNVHLVFTQYVDYLVAHDGEILAANPLWTYSVLNWTNTSVKNKIVRFISGIGQKITSKAVVKLNRHYYWQLKKAAEHKADLYIAHNLAALPIAVMAAKKTKAKCGFDAEDFHRHELSDDINDSDVKLKISVEEQYIPKTDYLTAASPLIAEQYSVLFNRSVITILNVFPKTINQSVTADVAKPLQLFWFSQTIGPNRGLETIIEAMQLSGVKIKLHLLGKVSDEYKVQLNKLATINGDVSSSIIYHQPVQPDDIFTMASQFDIGLSSEPGFCTNNKIALSNKLFTYIQCGLAVLVSDTIAQREFITQYPEIGKLYHNATELSDLLVFYKENRAKLLDVKSGNFQLGQSHFNWEMESQKLIKLIKHLLIQ